MRRHHVLRRRNQGANDFRGKLPPDLVDRIGTGVRHDPKLHKERSGASSKYFTAGLNSFDLVFTLPHAPTHPAIPTAAARLRASCVPPNAKMKSARWPPSHSRCSAPGEYSRTRSSIRLFEHPPRDVRARPERCVPSTSAEISSSLRRPLASTAGCWQRSNSINSVADCRPRPAGTVRPASQGYPEAVQQSDIARCSHSSAFSSSSSDSRRG